MSLGERGLDALAAAGEELAGLDGRFLLPALALQLANLGLRGIIWRNVVVAAYPGRHVAFRSVVGAYAVGVALNTFLPARGGEAAKVALLRSRIPGSTIVTLASTLSVVLLLDALLGLVLLGALAGFGVVPVSLPALDVALPVAAVALVAVGLLVHRFRSARVVGRIVQGAAVLRAPCRYLRTVVPFQLLAWGCRIGVAFFVLCAFRIDVGLATAALVVVFNGLSTAVPVPGGVGTQQVLAAFALRGVAPVAGAVSFSVGMQVGVTVVNTLVGLTALMLMLRTFRPGAVVRSGAALARSSRGR